jgi:predicted chitinase
MNANGNELLDLIRRGRRSSVESRRVLLESTQLMHQRERLRYLSNSLFYDIAELTRTFVNEIEEYRKSHRAENRS